ncbi:MAG: hypothetical protein Ct9H300mP1_35230 [Planctomycetaceae bacterium]|nr:MAG: hypothetical protein Ct9H300mP1_35230 [Planctomycetaceae bacterium]
MNFILGALPIMVMVFSLAISVHLVHYYRHAMDGPDPLATALKLAWKPCCLATLTTSIGLLRWSSVTSARFDNSAWPEPWVPSWRWSPG